MSKITWTKTGREVRPHCTITHYTSDGIRWAIESRKRDIPHANGSGYWQHTTYFLIDRAYGVEKEYYRLSDAKEAAERGGWDDLHRN